MTTPEERGKEILEMIKQRKINPGGLSTEFTGAKGSGKTSILLNFAATFTKKYPDEIQIWRDLVNFPLQFIKFPKWRIFVEGGVDFKIVDKNDEGSEVNIPQRAFGKLPTVSYDVLELEKNPVKNRDNEEKKQQQNHIFAKLLGMMHGGQLNVVYFRRMQSWMDLLRYLMTVPRWQTVFIDEYEDLWPRYSTAELWKTIEWAAGNLKQIRKGLVNLHVDTQSRTDVDWRIRNKMDVWGYLWGATPDMVSPVNKWAVSNLERGEGWLDMNRSHFGKINFLPYESDEKLFYVAEMA